MQIIEYIVLFAFLMLASVGWGAWGCERTKLPVGFLFILGFAVLAGLAYLVFFVFLLGPLPGRTTSCLLGLFSLGMAARQLAKPGVRRDLRQADVWMPLLLLFLYTASCLLVLLLHGGDPERGLSHAMPSDDILPQLLADRLWNGGPVRHFMGITLARMNPFVGDWLSSDRPPLQAALYLLYRPLEWLEFDQGDVYGIVSTLCQTMWVPAVYLLARELHFSRYALGFTLVWFAGNGFFLFHSVYTWPKLLAASLFLGGLSILLFCAENLPKKHRAALATLGLLWGLALLAHGGVLFSILAVPLLPSAWRLVRADAGSALAAIAVFILVSLPWAAYQKFYDPPANRLFKWYLAGVIPIGSRGSLETLREAYASLTFRQWWHNRRDNLEATLLWDNPSAQGALASAAALQSYLNTQCFFRMTAVLGLLNLGFVALAFSWWRRPRGPPLDSGGSGLLLMNFGCYLLWITLMFLPGSTVVHQGSYAMMILFMMIAARGLARLPAWVGLPLLVGQWGLYGFAFLYAFYVPVTRDTEWYLGQVLYWILTLLFVGGVCALPPRFCPQTDLARQE